MEPKRFLLSVGVRNIELIGDHLEPGLAEPNDRLELSTLLSMYADALRGAPGPAAFEVLDYTNDELYYPLGVYPSLAAARAAIWERESPNRPISPHVDEELEEIVIRERGHGWTGNGVEIERITRVEYYDGAADAYRWRRASN